VYRILSALRESETKSLNVVDLVERAKVSPTTLEKYIEVLKARGFITEKRNKERRIYITSKGEDFLFLFSRLLALWGE